MHSLARCVSDIGKPVLEDLGIPHAMCFYFALQRSVWVEQLLG